MDSGVVAVEDLSELAFHDDAFEEVVVPVAGEDVLEEGVVAVGEAGDVDDVALPHGGVVVGVLAEGAFVFQEVVEDLSFDDDLGVGRDFEVGLGEGAGHFERLSQHASGDLVFAVVQGSLVLHGHEEGGVVAEDDGAGGVPALCLIFREGLGVVAVGDHEEAQAAVSLELHALDGAVDDASLGVFEDHGSRGEVGPRRLWSSL